MEQELVELASAAANQVVKLLATDAWERVRALLGSAWRRARAAEADTVESDLTQARDHLMAAGDDDGEQIAQLLQAEWQGRLWRLMAADPAFADAIRTLLVGELGRPQDPHAGRVSLRARVSGGGSAYQAGRDQTITVHPSPPRPPREGDGKGKPA